MCIYDGIAHEDVKFTYIVGSFTNIIIFGFHDGCLTTDSQPHNDNTDFLKTTKRGFQKLRL